MKLKFFEHLWGNHPDMERENYIKELNFIYGAIWEISDVTEKIQLEICDIERERLSQKACENMEYTPVRFIKEYSKIAFFLAQEHYLSGKTFNIANLMKNVLSNFLDCGILDETNKKILKREISDTILDFKSASGLDKMSSIRMIPVIESMEKENK